MLQSRYSLGVLTGSSRWKPLVRVLGTVGLALALADCGDSNSSGGDSCTSLCDCVVKELGDGARSQCMSECNSLRNEEDADGECEDRVKENGAGACESYCDAFKKHSSGGSFRSCGDDDDCPSGQGCDTESGRMSPGYCTPLCDEDTDCPQGYQCPEHIKDQPGECDDQGEHRGERGICDQFDGVYGPDTCK